MRLGHFFVIASIVGILLFIFGGLPNSNPVKMGITGTAKIVGVARVMDTVQDMVARPFGQHSVVLNGKPSIDAHIIRKVLEDYSSPALVEDPQTWIDLGIQYNIDPAYALAFFVMESGCGSDPGWAGNKGDGTYTFNMGNIECTHEPCAGRFQQYNSWRDGIEAWYQLISKEYAFNEIDKRDTIESIIPKYAPAFENDVTVYINTVNDLVAKWRNGEL